MAKAKRPKQDLDDVRAAIENEGFDYAFRHYSSFDGVEDERFHELRRAYVAAAKALDEYVASNDE